MQLTPLPDSSFDLVDLGALKGSHPLVYSFNDFGWASGFASYEEPTRVEAFLFKAAAGTLLGNLGSTGSYGRNLNNLGDVVGLSNSKSYRAFLWREGTIYDLNACIPPDSGWLLADANAINDAGQIVGHGILNGTGEINGGGIVNGGHRAFVLNPVLGSAQALQLTLERTPQLNQWRLRLARQPTTNLYFEVSSDLVKWSPVNHSEVGASFLIQYDVPGYQFFRAAFKP